MEGRMEERRAWQEGLAIRYSLNKMERVAALRGIAWQPCMVAFTYAEDEDMGKKVIVVEGVKTGVRKSCLVVDLPQPFDREALVRRGVVVEMDYHSSLAVCGASWQGAARECPIRWRVLR
jgi:hypothetical protein